MPNLRKSILGPLDDLGGVFVGKVGLHLTASDGRSVTLTRAQVVAFFQAQTGTRAAKRAATIAWVKTTIRDALGAEQVDVASIAADFDDTDGTPTQLEVSG